MTAQDVFDKAVSRLRDGSGRSLRNGFPTYLADDGSRCVIGVFIPDGHAAQHSGSPFSERVSVVASKYPDLEMLREHLPLMMELQLLHDDDESWAGARLAREGETALAGISRRFGLVI